MSMLAPPLIFDLSQFLQVVFAAIRAMFQMMLTSLGSRRGKGVEYYPKSSAKAWHWVPDVARV